jgi:AcrR family transcriptional regulator
MKAPADAPAGRGQARTRLARKAVVAAARELFVARGYAATTIEAISERSDVPAATVYRLFSSKLGILKALLDASIGGDDQQVAVQDRPAVAALFGEPDPVKLLTGFAGITTAINERSNDIYRVLTSAASTDAAAAGLLEDMQRQRGEGQRNITRALARGGHLRDGVSESGAADLVHALMSPEVFGLLVADRGWSFHRYGQWLAATLIQQLLPAAQP